MDTNKLLSGCPTSMDLGPHVVIRSRKDGTNRVLFEVSKKCRPEKWPATIPLPLMDRRGNLSDPEEVERIKKDAQILQAELSRQKNDKTAVQSRSWVEVNRLYQESTRYKNLAKETKRTYSFNERRVLKYFSARPELTPSSVKESDIERLLQEWDYSQYMKIGVLNYLKLLLGKAIREGWRADDPTAAIHLRAPNPTVTLWEQADVDAYSSAAQAEGMQDLAKIILTEWEIGQRLTDVVNFRHGKQWNDGVFRFWQQKTNAYVTIPVPAELTAMIEAGASKGALLFQNPQTGAPYTFIELGRQFRSLRDKMSDLRPLRLKNLRHSCVVQLARAGCTIPEIGSITGHKYTTVHKILEKYLPRDNVLAFHAVEKRSAMKRDPKQVMARTLPQDTIRPNYFG